MDSKATGAPSVGWDLENAKDTGIHRATVDLVVTFSESVTDFFGG
jgi:hypothetical protein